MRTGAIFARGSCRALRLVAAMGVLSMLGSAQVAAQPVVDRASYSTNTVTIVMDKAVRVSSGTAADLAFSAFTITGNAATAHTVDAGGGNTTFTVTFTSNLAGIATQMTYTEPTSGARIVDATSGTAVASFTVTVLPATPWLPTLDNHEVQRGVPADIQLPPATYGGTGTLTYNITTTLPAGLSFAGATRKITGTTTVAVQRVLTTYEVSDGSVSSNGSFFIDVVEPPALSVIATASPTTIAEGGTSTITATANRPVMAADGTVTVNLAVVGDATFSGNSTTASITIAAGDTSGTATLTSTADADHMDDTVTVTVTGTNGVAANHPNIVITVTDPPPPAPLSVVVTADPTTIEEGGASTITATANRAVAASDGTVTVNLRVVGEATLNANSITLAAGDTSGTVTLTSTADKDYEDDTVTLTVTGTAIAANHPNVVITVTDPAPPAALTVGVTAKPTTIEEGGTSTITATANRPVTAADGTVTVDLSVVGDATLSANSITIKAGANTGTVTLTATADADYEDETVTVTYSGTGITGNKTLSINVTDKDTPPAKRRGQITAMTFSGGTRGPKTIGGVERYHVYEGDTTVMLNVTVQWDHAELAELAALGKKTVGVDLMIKGAQPAEQIHVLPRWLSWIDDEGDVDFPNTTGELGRLSGRIMVPVPAAPKDYPNSIRHHKSSSGSIALLILHDEHEAEEDAFYIDAVDSADVDLDATDAKNRTTPLAVIEDDDPQKVTIKGKNVMHEGASPETFTIEADPKRLDLPLEVRLDVVDLDGATISGTLYSLSDASLVFNEGGNGVNKLTVTLRFPSPDGNREDDNYKLQASVVDYSLTSGGFDTTVVDEHAIKIVDIHRLPPVTVEAYPGMLMEGDEVTLTLKVDRNPSETPRVDPETNIYTYEPLTIVLDPDAKTTARAAERDYEVVLPTGVATTAVPVPMHGGKAPWVQEVKVTVKALPDENIEGDEPLVFDATMTGNDFAKNDPANKGRMFDDLVSLTLTDETEKVVWAKSMDEIQKAVYDAKMAAQGADGMLNPGEDFSIEGMEMFGHAPGVSVTYSASSSTAAVHADGDDTRVMIEPKMAGKAMITVTATATTSAGVTIVDQTKPNVAEVKFELDVMLEDLTYTIEPLGITHLVEGAMPADNGTPNSAVVKVIASRALAGDEMVEISLMRDGSSSATMGDFSVMPEMVTLTAGDEMAEFTVTATEDGMPDSGAGMPEMLTLFAVINGMQTDKAVSFNIWDAAVPALPVIAQLLLAAFLAVGGYRRYRRR